MAESAAPLLAARHLSYVLDGRPLVDDVSLALARGSLTVLVGPNGAGKTTLLRLLSGELSPTRGDVELDGKPLRSYPLKALARRRAVLPQATTISFPFTVFQVALMGRYPHLGGGGETHHDYAVTESALARADVAHLTRRAYPTLSGGEQGRVNLARALAQETPLLFLDEPTAHLDPRHQHDVLRIARELCQEGATVLAILHDLNLALAYADQLGVMAAGRMQAFGPPDEILSAELLETVFSLPFRHVPLPWADRPLWLPVPGPSLTNQVSGNGRPAST
jgi:iron complex transport system ATP-binding protein